MANGKKFRFKWQSKLPKRCKRLDYYNSIPTNLELKKKPYKCPLCRKFHIAEC